MKFRVIGKGTNFIENGVEFQISARTPKQSDAAFTYSCLLCSKDTCSKERCAIHIAHEVAKQRMKDKAPVFFEKGVFKQSKAYCVNFATKNFEYSCECCKTAGWDQFQVCCSECPINKAYTKNLKEIGGKKNG